MSTYSSTSNSFTAKEQGKTLPWYAFLKNAHVVTLSQNKLLKALCVQISQQNKQSHTKGWEEHVDSFIHSDANPSAKWTGEGVRW